MTTKLAASLALALGLGLVFTQVGCGSGPMGNPRPSLHASADGPSVPAATVAQLRDCAEHGAARLTDTHYAIVFDVDVTADGQVDKAKIRESLINDREIISCMVDALHGMSLPGVIATLRPSGPISGGRVSPEGRDPMGHPAAVVAGAVVNLVPIVLVAGGVTIPVAVTVHVVSEIPTSTRDTTDEEREKKRCKKVKQECIEYCSDTTLPTPDFGWKFQKCKNDCLERQGCPRDS
ncbi:hypothetical protein [Polyangium jinanense]|uniref:Uncharacterized protein n=1 Tax=Polyangium jinanense TaxID=2829994 RepID=A0A9X4AT27_9BACT|nr:hypothetical protein [Polyangium jinanense]MDC3959918.1 hypothetical protein [Polyangium jinanense]MDC3983798.1 hypothetical protein [Polyangium jinanense]